MNNNIHPIFEAVNESYENCTELRRQVIGEIMEHLFDMPFSKLAIIASLACDWAYEKSECYEIIFSQFLDNIETPITIGGKPSED